MVNKAAAYLMKQEYHVFSPISHSHPIALEGDLPKGWDYWQQYDEKILQICDEMLILTIDGWKESNGITGEIKIARELGIPVGYMQIVTDGKYKVFRGEIH